MKRSPLILVVREFDKFSAVLKKSGLTVINLPLIQTLPLEDLSELDEKLAGAEKYDGLFFTSPKAAEIFLQRNLKSKFRGKIYVLGNRTGFLFENAGFEIVSRPEANTAEEFINSFPKGEFAGKKFLFARGDRSLRVIPELLKSAAEIDEIVVYRTVENSIDENLIDEIGEKFRRREIDWICFFSPSAVESFVKTFDDFSPDEIKIAVIGTTTARKAEDENLKVEFVSPKASAKDFAFGLIKFFTTK